MKNKISNIEFCSLLYFIIRASFLGITFNSITNISNQDNWIAIIISFIIGIIPLFLFIYIINYKPEISIIEKNRILFKKFGFLINWILILFFFVLSCIIFYNLNVFIASQYLNKTPLLIVTIVFAVTILYVSLKDIDAIARSFLFFSLLAIILFFICWISLIPNINIDNLKPILITDKSSIFHSCIIYISYNILPIIILTIIPKNKISNSKKLTAHIIITYIISNFTLFIVSFTTIGTLGIYLSKIFEFPEFQVLRYIAFIGLESRFDSIIFIHWIFDMICFIVISLHFFKEYANKTFKFNNKLIVYTVSLLLISITQIYTKTINTVDYINRHILPNIILPVILLVLIITSILIYKNKKNHLT